MNLTLYEAHPSMVRSSPFKFALSVLLIPVFGLGILILLFWYVSTKADKFEIRAGEVLWTHGLLNKQYTEISMSSIRTIKISQSIIQRMLNAGDIEIYTSGDAPELSVKGLPDPRRIRELIRTGDI